MIAFLLRLMPPAAWMTALGLLVATAVAWHYVDRHRAVSEAVSDVHAEYAARAADAEAANRAEEQHRARLAKEADDARLVQIKRAERSAAAARTELGRLQLLLAGRGEAGPGGTPAGRVDAAGTARALGECADTVHSLATNGERIAVKANALQRYITDQCGAGH